MVFSDEERALENSKLALILSQNNHYVKGQIKSLSRSSQIYMRMGNMEKALDANKMLEKVSLESNDYISLCNALRLKSIVLAKLGLYDEALKNADNALKFSENISSKYSFHRSRGLIYQAKSIILVDKEKVDSVRYKLCLKENFNALSEFQKMNKIKRDPQIYTVTLSNIAWMYINLKKLDSGKIYLKQAMRAQPYADSNSEKETFYYLEGKIKLEENDYKAAIQYFQKAYELNKMYTNDPYKNKNIFEGMYLAYKGLGHEKEYLNYLAKHEFLTDSLSMAEKRALSGPVKEIIQKNEQKTNEKTSYIRLTLIILVLGICLAAVICYLFYIKYQKEKKLKKLNEISVIEKETKLVEMEKKINVTFEEVIRLAKSDDPAFLPRFKEVYPDFYNRLLAKYPDLTPGQLKFCAMLRLNFSTKEIAQYSHISIRSVEIKRGRLRKELNILSSENLNKWMMEF